jgi:MoxR-like ATPase
VLQPISAADHHALLLGGAQGIGKDTLLEPVKRAVGQWNFIEASPVQVLGASMVS